MHDLIPGLIGGVAAFAVTLTIVLANAMWRPPRRVSEPPYMTDVEFHFRDPEAEDQP